MQLDQYSRLTSMLTIITFVLYYIPKFIWLSPTLIWGYYLLHPIKVFP